MRVQERPGEASGATGGGGGEGNWRITEERTEGGGGGEEAYGEDAEMKVKLLMMMRRSTQWSLRAESRSDKSRNERADT
ncbi:unnamed protein product [Lampetra planeri]